MQPLNPVELQQLLDGAVINKRERVQSVQVRRAALAFDFRQAAGRNHVVGVSERLRYPLARVVDITHGQAEAFAQLEHPATCLFV